MVSELVVFDVSDFAIDIRAKDKRYTNETKTFFYSQIKVLRGNGLCRPLYSSMEQILSRVFP